MSNGAGIEALADGVDFRGRDEQEYRRWIDEPAYQPRARDAIDLGPRARHPNGAAAAITPGYFVGGNGRPLCCGPTEMAALKRLGRDAALTEPGGGTFAELLTLLANHDDGLTGQARRPVVNIAVRPPRRAGDQAWIGGKVIVNAHVDESRRLGGADEPGKFFGGDEVV